MIAILIILILLFLFVIANEYYRHVVIRNDQEAHIKRGSKVKNAYDIVAFGSSYGRYAFDFSECGINWYNFGFVAQFFYYTDKMIRAFRPSYNADCKVVITVPDLCFAEVGDGLYHPQRYVSFLDKSALGKEWSIKNYFLYVIFPLLSSRKNIKRLIKHVLGKDKDTYASMLKNPLNESKTMAQALIRTSGWVSSFGLYNTTTDVVPKELEKKFQKSTDLLSNIIQYCLDEGLKPCLVVTPVSSVMNSLLSDAFLKKVLYSNIRKANKQNIPVFDYLRDERFQDIDLYAANADFLNARGRKLFSNVFYQDLTNYYNK